MYSSSVPLTMGVVLLPLLPSNLSALDFNFTFDPSLDTAIVESVVTAGNTWAAILDDDVTVNVDFTFESFGLDPVGGALPVGGASAEVGFGSYQLIRSAIVAEDPVQAPVLLESTTDAVVYIDGTGFLSQNVNITRANAKALNLLDGSAVESDGDMRFNSDVTWDFDGGEVTPGTLDFTTVVMHEIGHLLGFTSGLAFQEVGLNVAPFVFDLFRFSDASLAFAAANGLTYIPDYSLNTDPKYFISGAAPNDPLIDPFTEVALSLGSDIDGEQPSHWKEQNPDLGLMDPFIALGESNLISGYDLELFGQIGWDVNEEILALFPPGPVDPDSPIIEPLDDTVAIPEPSAAFILLWGGLAAVFIAWRKRSRK